MSQPRFLADEDFRRDIVDAVLGIAPQVDFARVQELGLSESTDEEVLQYAFENGRVVVSHDRSTMSAAAVRRIEAGMGMAGLVLVKQNATRRIVAEQIAMIAGATEPAEWLGTIDFLPWRGATS